MNEHDRSRRPATRPGFQKKFYPPRRANDGPPPEGRLICGLQPVREAVRAHGSKLLRVILETSASPTLDALGRFATDQGVVVEREPRGELDHRALGGRHQGAVAYAPALHVLTSTAELPATEQPLILCLDELEDPQNFGAIVRSAVALAATCVVWPEHHSAPLSAAMFRASAGAVEHACLVRVPALPAELQALRDRGVVVVGLDADAKNTLSDLDLRGPVAIVVGSEGRGLRKPVKQACTRLARLPMTKLLGSLNASVAAAIALYEVGRQRSGAGSPVDVDDGAPTGDVDVDDRAGDAPADDNDDDDVDDRADDDDVSADDVASPPA